MALSDVWWCGVHAMRDRPPRPWHLYLLGLVAAVVIALAITQVGPSTSSARTSREIVQTQDGVVQSTVSGSGNVEASTDDTLNFDTSGTLQEVYVTVGEHVKQGQLLATLDPSSEQLALDQAREELTAAEDDLTDAENGTSTGSGSGGNGDEDTSYDRGSSTTEFVSDTRNESATPTATTDSTPTTTSPTATAPTATVTVTVTTPSTTTPSTGSSHPSTGSGSSSSSATGSSSSDTTTTTTTTTTTPSPSAIASARASVDSAEETVRNDETALEETKLYAPVSGTVASLESIAAGQSVSGGSSDSSDDDSSSSSSSSTGGAAATTAGSLGSSSSDSSSSGFATIINSGTLTMTVAFSESDIGSVKVGQPATISMDALSGVELAAHVTAISPVGTTSDDVVSYDATLTADQNDPEIRPGMSATATVIIGQAQGVTVPNEAITGTGSTGTVNVTKNGKTVSQSVVIGLRGTSRTQVISGLTAGENVVETTTLPSLGSTSSSSTSSSSGGTLGGSGSLGGGLPSDGLPAGGFPGGG